MQVHPSSRVFPVNRRNGARGPEQAAGLLPAREAWHDPRR